MVSKQLEAKRLSGQKVPVPTGGTINSNMATHLLSIHIQQDFHDIIDDIQSYSYFLCHNALSGEGTSERLQFMNESQMM